MTNPASRNSQTISRWVQAVVTAITQKMPQSSGPESVSFASFWTDRAMMPMTAAPTP